jgi:hypothetical protein
MSCTPARRAFGGHHHSAPSRAMTGRMVTANSLRSRFMFAKSARKQELYAAPSWSIASVAWAVSFGSAGTISRTRRDSVRWFAAVWHAVTVPRTSPAEAVWPIAPMSSWIFWSWGFRLRGPGDKLVIRRDGRRGRRRPRRDRTVLRAAAGRSQGDDDWDHPEPSLHRLPSRSGRSLRAPPCLHVRSSRPGMHVARGPLKSGRIVSRFVNYGRQGL